MRFFSVYRWKRSLNSELKRFLYIIRSLLTMFFRCVVTLLSCKPEVTTSRFEECFPFTLKNRSFPSFLLPLSKWVYVPNHSYENEFRLQVHFDANQIISIQRFLHKASFWNRGTRQLRKGLFQPIIREDSAPDLTLHLAMVPIIIAYLHNQKQFPETIALTPVFSVNGL